MHIPRVCGKIRQGLLFTLLVVSAGSATTLQASAAPVPPSTLRAAFHAAALRYQEPEDLLLAIAWVNTHWEMQHSDDNGFGLMHLVKDPKHDSVAAAAVLSGHTEADLETNPPANVDGGAALLAQAQGATRPSSLAGWAPALTQLGGGLFTSQVFDTLKRGAARTTSRGEPVTLAPQPQLSIPAPTAPRAAAQAPMSANAPAAAGNDYSGAAWAPADPANFSVFDRPTDSGVQMIVIHVSQGSYAGTIAYFQNPSAAASAHYVTQSSDGAITQTVHEKDVAWHAGNWDYNARAIGIEHEGFVNDPTWFTDAMYRHSAQLSAYLAVKYGIPIDRLHIIGHNEVPDPNNPGQFGGAGHHTDPGPYWNWGLYMTYVQQYASTISCGASPWTMYPGAANDVAVGANGTTWVVGTNPVQSGFGIFQWTASGWSSIAGGAVRIAVDPTGQPWVINSNGEIWRHLSGGGWQLLPGSATDIGIGADGTVWITGTNSVTSGHAIYRWSGSTWGIVGGGAIRISVDAKGAPWVVNEAGSIFEWTGTGWTWHPGTAHDIGVGGTGNDVWVTGNDSVPGGHSIFHLTGSGWASVAGGATNIAVGPGGAPWITNSVGTIFAGRAGQWLAQPGAAMDVAVGADGTTWITGTYAVGGGHPIYKWTAGGWSIIGGGAIYLAVTPTGVPWVVNDNGEIFKLVGANWQVLPGSANGIAIGSDGSTWILGTNVVAGGYDVENWTGSAWTVVPGAGVHIAVGTNGQPWVVNSNGEIFQRVASGTWQQIPSSALDVGIGADGSVWKVGGTASCGGFGVSRWNGSGWDAYEGAGFRIAVGPDGRPWLVNSPGTIFRLS